MAFAVAVMAMGKSEVYAGTYNDAYSYYKSFGNRAVFVPSDNTNGYIYCGTKGKSATSDIRYKTIGWKMSFYDFDGKTIQTLYFKLGGGYLKQISSKETGGYKYDLYRMELESMKSRLSSKAVKLLKEGKCQLTLDACMVVTKGSRAGGSMDDSGIKSGKVYTTYEGIKSAEDWSSASRTALLSYFGKNVENLFFNITVKKDPGIKAADGAGTYCYGTKLKLYGEAMDGYDFIGWKNGSLYKGSSRTITVTKNEIWTAKANPVSMTIKYYRNFDEKDMESVSHTYVYGKSNQRIIDCKWQQAGYHFDGWAMDRASESLAGGNEKLDTKWIVRYRNGMELFARYSPNKYTIHFEGILLDDIPDMDVNYEENIELPENGGFLGWSINAENNEPDYCGGDMVSIANLATNLGIADDNGAIICLYAIWECMPRIDAGDLYYSLEFAQEGRITEEEIAGHARAFDSIDGEICYGFNANNYFIIPVFYDSWFTGLTESDSVKVCFSACNSMGVTAEQEVTVHIVDTSQREVIAKDYRIRFISDRYFKSEDGEFVDEKAGGLLEDSCWKKDYSFMTLLQCALEP